MTLANDIRAENVRVDRRVPMRRRGHVKMTLLGLLLAAAAAVCPAQTGNPSNASQLPAALQGIGIDQRLGEALPLDVTLRDELGREVRLGDYFGDRPVILALVYYECPMLCTLELNGLLKTIRVVPLTLGKDYQIVTVSFDPGETPALAARKKQEYIEQYRQEGAEHGWHFLTAEQQSIDRLTEAMGFRYKYDPETDLYTHASAIMLATPEGKLSRYFYGVEYSPRDVRLGLVEASQNQIGSFVDQVLLFCFHYDPVQGKYSLVILNGLRAAGIATVLAIFAFLWIMLRRDRSRAAVAPAR